MEGSEGLLTGAGLGVFVLFLVAGMLLLVKQLLHITKPNEIIVFSGRSRTLADGTTVGYSILDRGRKIRIPLIEQAERMDVSTMTVDIQVANAYSRGNIPLNVHAIANVKVCTRPGIVDNAVERFLGRGREEIRRVAKETIEGALRGVLATLTPEQVNEDRLSFVEALSDEVEEDLNKIGLQIDTLKIQSVSDETNYLDSIGRARIAEVLRDAEIAESDYKREADRLIADAQARSRVAQEQAKARIQVKQNELRQFIADLEATAKSEEERTTAAASEARARAEVRLQEVRRQLERLRLQAEEVLPAEASQEAKELLAQGESSSIAAEGYAAAEALRYVSEAWKSAGRNAEDIFVIQQIEPLLRQIARKIDDMGIDKVNVIDGGNGESIGKLAAAYPTMVRAVLDSVGDTMGINLRGILSREVQIDESAPPLPERDNERSVFQVRSVDNTSQRTTALSGKSEQQQVPAPLAAKAKRAAAQPPARPSAQVPANKPEPASEGTSPGMASRARGIPRGDGGSTTQQMTPTPRSSRTAEQAAPVPAPAEETEESS